MGRYFYEFVEKGGGGKFVCRCGADIASDNSMIWEGYMHYDVPAFLLKNTVNAVPSSGVREETLSTGKYQLVDVKCRICNAPLGWRYIYSEAVDQKYKENCSLLQQAALSKVSALGS